MRINLYRLYRFIAAVYSLSFISANRAITDELMRAGGGIRAISVRRLFNYSPFYAISFAPLTKLTRLAINRVL